MTNRGWRRERSARRAIGIKLLEAALLIAFLLVMINIVLPWAAHELVDGLHPPDPLVVMRAIADVAPGDTVGEWLMPWNTRDGVGRLGPGIPESDLWASEEEGAQSTRARSKVRTARDRLFGTCLPGPTAHRGM